LDPGGIDYEKIGQRIRKVRVKKGLSQAALAEKAHVGVSHMSDIELGKSVMRLSTFIRISEVLQVSTDMLLRPNIPEVNGVYQTEFAELLQDCSPGEIESILAIVKEVKSRLKSSRDIED